MKKFLVWGVGLLAVCAYAENVPTVTFNPSRMGDYSWLKVSDEAKLKGGLKTKTLDLYGRSTTIQDNTTPDPRDPLYATTEVQSITSNNNKYTHLIAKDAVFAKDAGAYACSTLPSEVCFQEQPATLEVSGGHVEFQNTSGGAGGSTIKKVQLNNAMLQDATQVHVSEMNVAGITEGTNAFLSPSSTVDEPTTTLARVWAVSGPNSGNWEDLQSNGLVLGARAIPYPKAVQYYATSGATGTADITLDDPNCKFKWVKRYVAGDEVKAVYVLALDGCGVENVKTCQEGVIPWVRKTVSCPSTHPDGKAYQNQQLRITCNNGEATVTLEDVGSPDYSRCKKYKYEVFNPNKSYQSRCIRHVRLCPTRNSTDVKDSHCYFGTFKQWVDEGSFYTKNWETFRSPGRDYHCDPSECSKERAGKTCFERFCFFEPHKTFGVVTWISCNCTGRELKCVAEPYPGN